MLGRKRFWWLATVEVVVCALVTVVSVTFAYREMIRVRKTDLAVHARGLSALTATCVEQLSRMRSQNPGPFEPIPTALLDRIGASVPRFGRSGEWSIVRLGDGRTDFVAGSLPSGPTAAHPLPGGPGFHWDDLGVDLSKGSTTIGVDDRGRRVLAAFEPVPGTDLGVVTKLDMSEVHGSFVQVAAWISALAVLAVVGGTWLLGRKNHKLLDELHLQSTALQAAADGVVITNTSGGIVWLNDAVEQLTGYTRAELIGKNPRILKSGCHRPSFYRNLWQTISAGYVWTGNVRNRRKDGSVYDERMSITPVHDQRGKITHYIAIKQDVSALKATERRLHENETELARYREHLEELVHERTAEIEAVNAKLADEIKERTEAQEQADRASRAKGDFLATMSHELRTPLNGVIGSMDLLLGTNLDENQQRAVQLAKTSGALLLTLINDILDFSKIEAGRLELESLEFDLVVLTENVAGAFAHRVAEKDIELVHFVHPAVPRVVVGDPTRLQQILTNLVGNAVKFTQAGQIAIRVTLDEESESGFNIRFTVNDTGIGIGETERKRLFQSFSQCDTSTTRKYGGTGLGLVICKQLVSLMQGRIDVESEPGRGSTFWFTARFDKPAVESPPKRLSDDVRQAHVLVVSHDDQNPTPWEDLLTDLHLVHASADNTQDALRRIREAANADAPFSVVILDTPQDWTEAKRFARQVKAEQATANTILLVVCETGTGTAENNLKSAGFSGELTKPVDASALSNAIAAAYACAPQSAQSEEAAHRKTAPSDATDMQVTPATILVAEDNEIGQMVAGQLLSKAGYEFEMVDTGVKAVDAWKRSHFDVILMDCQMPEMDGFEATRRIREEEHAHPVRPGRLKHTPIIALTANAIRGDRERCLDAGMDDYVSKPFEFKHLIETIESQIAQARKKEHKAMGSTDPETDAAAAQPLATEINSQAVRLDQVLERWGGDESFVWNMIDRFLEQAPADVKQLEQTLDQKNLEEATRIAHGLKGAAAYCGAERFRKVAADMEQLGRDGRLTDLDGLLETLRSALEVCSAEFEKIRTSEETVQSEKA